MSRLIVFVLLGVLAATTAGADRAMPPAAPIDPPGIEGMIAEAPTDAEAELLGDLPADIPDYRGAQKPEPPAAVQPATP